MNNICMIHFEVTLGGGGSPMDAGCMWTVQFHIYRFQSTFPIHVLESLSPCIHNSPMVSTPIVLQLYLGAF